MTLEDIVHTVEYRLLGLGRLLWRTDPLAPIYDALDANEVQLGKRRQELALCESERAALAKRLSDRRAAADLLAAQTETSLASGDAESAWRLALDLDRMRQALADDAKQLPRLEQVAWSLGFRIRQLERERSRLQEQAQARR